MTTIELFLFILIFILPIAYQRSRFLFQRSHFEELNIIRKKTEFQIHHGHWGLLWVFITSIWFIFFDKNIYLILLAGFGWGLITDEIIPSLKVPGNDRELELQIYSKTKKSSFILAGVMVISFVILAFL